MSEHLDPNASIEIPCGNEHCTEKSTKTVEELKAHPKFACTACGCEIDATEFNAGLEKANKDIDDLLRGLGGLLQ